MKFFWIFLVLFVSCKTDKTTKVSEFKIGIIADCQYCNCETKNNRFYTKSPKRLKLAVEKFNTQNLAYTIHLGDFIDKDFESFDTVLPTWKKLISEKYHVLGNHDFSVLDSLKTKVPAKLNLKNRYYSFKKYDWRFIILDGNDLSFYASLSEEKNKEKEVLFKSLENKNLPNVKPWNGGLSTAQLNWIQKELEEAKEKKEKVGFYCHFPAVKDGDIHNLWNYKAFLELIAPYNNVKFYFNGHNHQGDYVEKKGVHHLTFKGMVDVENSTAYAIATVTNDSIFIEGFGREISRKLKIK